MIIVGNSEPMKNIDECCKHCEVIEIATSKDKSITLEQARKKCAACKKKTAGIYKFDAIYQLIQIKTKLFGGRRSEGRKPVMYERHHKQVYKLLKAGYTQKEIADALGINKNTVNKIVKQLKAISVARGKEKLERIKQIQEQKKEQ